MSRYWTAHSDLDWYQGERTACCGIDYYAAGEAFLPTAAEEEAAMAEIEALREADRRRAVLQEAADWLRRRCGRLGELVGDRMLKELAP